MALSLFFPENGVQFSDDIKLHFISFREIFGIEKNYADISEIIENNALLNDTVIENHPIEEQSGDNDTVIAEVNNLKESISQIQFPKNNHKVLYTAFKAFDNAANAKKPVRILHYGDSQIEGDRISSFLRYKLQQKFGGIGVGLIPVQQGYDFGFSVTQKNSGNWHRYTMYGIRDTKVIHEKYGALGSFCRFSPYLIDSLNNGNPSIEAWVSFSPSAYSYTNTRILQQCRVFYSQNTAPFLTELYEGGVLVDVDMYPKSNSFQTIRWVFEHPVSNIKIIFKGTESPDIYGIALDGLAGIAVDNIAMRGSSGLFFTRIDKKNLKEHYRELNVKMIILQFGGNVVTNITKDYSYYEKYFYSQLKRIQEVMPDVAIIVIGVADMSVKEKDGYVTYPNLEKVRDALKNATFKADAAYWDMYEAMGGKNSMPSWVLADPPLASKDFVHFNMRGANTIALMFYKSIIYEYNLYKKDIVREENSAKYNETESR
jgi:lysophospholipase L1-like esterase